MVDWTVRRASEVDLDRLVMIEEQNTYGRWSRSAFDGSLRNHGLWVAEKDSKTVAFIAFAVVGDELQIHNMAVDLDYRRQGGAHFFLRRLFKWAEDQGVRSVDLDVRSDNQAAQSLYRGLGFLAYGQRLAYYSDGVDSVLMRAKL